MGGWVGGWADGWLGWVRHIGDWLVSHLLIGNSHQGTACSTRPASLDPRHEGRLCMQCKVFLVTEVLGPYFKPHSVLSMHQDHG